MGKKFGDMVPLRLCAFAQNLRVNCRGSILLQFGLALIPLTFAIGFAIDYSRAQQLQTQLAAIADSAVLAAVDPSMISQSDAVAGAAASAMFKAQVANVAGLVAYTLTGPTVTDVTSGNFGSLRSVKLSFAATSRNVFGTILGIGTLPISGAASAAASQPPSINFYVAMDNSPSMLLPTTSAGISLLEGSNNNCAFSCHINQYVYNAMMDSSGNYIFIDQNYYNNGVNQIAGIYRYNPGNRNLYDGNNNLIGISAYGSPWNGNSGGTLNWTSGGRSYSANVYWADPYWLAENYGKAYPASGVASIPLRIDAELSAAQSLITTAQTAVNSFVAANPSIAYKMQFFTLNYQVNTLTSSLTNVNSLSPSMIVPSNGTLAPYISSNGYFPTSINSTASPGYYTNNSDSSPYASLGQMNNLMPNPGSGLPNTTPQEVLMIVTDGYQDEMINGAQVRQQWNQATLDECTAIKSRGIRIAILYTTYDPNTVLPDYPYYAGFTPSIAGALQSCASPGTNGSSLMYQVSVNQDISTALGTLFAMTVQTARLVQ